jgi:hypothetical protein
VGRLSGSGVGLAGFVVVKATQRAGSSSAGAGGESTAGALAGAATATGVAGGGLGGARHAGELEATITTKNSFRTTLPSLEKYCQERTANGGSPVVCILGG